jgi:DMSO/TMAO reductase YedYZ molybdopterin-dependent catalytic subunit
MTNKKHLQRRTLMSFAVLILFGVAIIVGWTWLKNQPLLDATPAPLRQSLELNGRLWRKLFDPKRLNRATPSRKGQRPRVNGDIGLNDNLKVEDWRLEVIEDNMDENSRHIILTMQDIRALPRSETAANFRCIEGWSADVAYAGVKFSDFMKAYGLKPNTYVGFETNDGEYYVSLDMESMLHEQTMLAYEMNGEPLSLQNGAPLRLIIPIKYGIKSLKKIGKIFLSNERPPDYWAERGYDWYSDL